jgi:hypothetical protein
VVGLSKDTDSCLALSDLMASLLIAATIKLVFSYNGLCRACVCVRGGGEGREGGREREKERVVLDGDNVKCSARGIGACAYKT